MLANAQPGRNGAAPTPAARTATAKAEPADTGALVPDVIDPDVLWSCTTCGACVEQCPVDIEHVDAIIDMRRYEVMMESRFPTEAGTMLRNIENRGDPWGLGAVEAPRVDRGPRLRGPGRRRARSPTTSSTCSGSAAPARSTSGPAR